jgi:ABC-type branched-subunit amino acid transport system substrate-binding protein
MKKHFTTTAALLTISLLLAACSAAPYKCTDPLGCLEIPPDSPILIGAILATSGEQGSLGAGSLQNVEKTLAEKDKILGHSIQLVRYSTDCSAESTRVAATEFAIKDRKSVV